MNNKLEKIYRIVAKIPSIEGLHVAYYSANSDYQAMNKMIDRHDITIHDIKSVSWYKNYEVK